MGWSEVIPPHFRCFRGVFASPVNLSSDMRRHGDPIGGPFEPYPGQGNIGELGEYVDDIGLVNPHVARCFASGVVWGFCSYINISINYVSWPSVGTHNGGNRSKFSPVGAGQRLVREGMGNR